MGQNVGDIEDITKRIDTMNKMLQKSKEEGKLSVSVLESVEQLAMYANISLR